MTNDVELSEVLSEFARTVVTDFPIQAILDDLVQRIVEVLPVTGAGVTLIEPGREPHFVAASSGAALRYEQLQSEVGEGPCIAAFESGTAVSVPDLRADDRFPTFAPLAVAAGLVAVFTFSLRDGTGSLGALDLYRDSAGPLDEATMAAAQTLADVATAYLLNAQARTDLQESSDRAREMALHDPLTGLPNRLLLLARLDHAVERGRRSGAVAAVLFVDLDSFKVVNDLHGHGIGDALLLAVAERMGGLMRPGDTLARLSGDEFVVLCEGLDHASEADAIAERLVTAVAEPFALDDVELHITASVGIAFSGRTDQLPEQLLDDADAAMYQAKRRGGDLHQVIDLRQRQRDAERTTLEQDLRGVLQRDELHVEYRPIVAVPSRTVTGVEAIVRWVHPVRGIIPANLFLPLAEHCALVPEMGLWTLGRACADRSRLIGRRSGGGLSLHVGISAHELMAPSFAAGVAALLVAAGTDPRSIILELTEHALDDDRERALVVLRDLRRLGVRVALVDFGLGCSSLGLLRDFPIDVVKLDARLTTDVATDATVRAIIAAVVSLAHALEMEVVADGIETAEQRRLVAALGCDRWQGDEDGGPLSAAALDLVLPTNLGPRR